jgi:hypothetical protein
MKEKNWFKPKAFTHLTRKLKQEDGYWIKNYVSDPENIKRHKFFPLIHRTIIVKRFKESKDLNDNPIKKHYTYLNGIRNSNVKYREIYYPNHLDAHVYSYYTQKVLEPIYERELKKNSKLDQAVLAYRRIPLKDGSRCKCNIDFANEVFDEIKNSKGQIAVLALDISKFFDSLDHRLLKQIWANLLNRKDLEKDHYNIFKSLTQFAYVEMRSLLIEFGFKHPNQLIQDEVSFFVENGTEFRNRIKSKGYIKKNPFRRKEKSVDGTDIKKMIGIPQGTPMSAFLANLYLLNFDNEVLELIKDIDGIYRRYSDDILVICPKNIYPKIEAELYKLIKNFKLVIQPTKTQRSFFLNGKLEKGEKPVIYLGFQFDGYRKLLKSASISKFYRKMKTNVKFRAYRASVAKSKKMRGKIVDATIHRKKLYTQFSFLGSAKTSLKKRNYFSYANFASRIMNSPEINNQLSNAWKILHHEIARQEKKYKLPRLK